jgi:hypothetical protein
VRRYPELTGEGALRRATSTGNLIDLLQAEEDLMIRTFGPPWVEHPVTFQRGATPGMLRGEVWQWLERDSKSNQRGSARGDDGHGR